MGTRIFGLPRTPVIAGLAVAALLLGGIVFMVLGRGNGGVAQASPEPSASSTPSPSPSAESSPGTSASPSPSPTASPPAGAAVCPLNGLPVEEELLERDPLLVQIENHPEARPQSNLTRSDLLIEAPVEGDTTRFSALFLCRETEGLVGPVRSGRYYNVDLFQMMHVIGIGFGASPGTEQRLFGSGTPFLNGIYGEFPQFFPRVNGRAAPHNLYLDLTAFRSALEAGDNARLEEFRTAAVAQGPLRPPFTFNPSANFDEAGRTVLDVTVWTNSFWVFGWTYDPERGEYVRSDDGLQVTDEVDGEPLTRRTIVLQIVSQTEVFDDPDPGGYSRRDQHLVGEGVGTLYVDSRAIDLRWERLEPSAPTTWTIAQTGDPLVLPPGTVYWGIIPDTGSVIEE